VPFVYLLRCRDGSLYAGAAKDLALRLARHRAGKASRYTRSRLPVELAWWREVGGWGEALRAELRLKRLDRAAKEDLLRAEGSDAGGGEDGDAPPAGPGAAIADGAGAAAGATAARRRRR